MVTLEFGIKLKDHSRNGQEKLKMKRKYYKKVKRFCCLHCLSKGWEYSREKTDEAEIVQKKLDINIYRIISTAGDGETYRARENRQKEHQDKLRLTSNIERAIV